MGCGLLTVLRLAAGTSASLERSPSSSPESHQPNNVQYSGDHNCFVDVGHLKIKTCEIPVTIIKSHKVYYIIHFAFG